MNPVIAVVFQIITFLVQNRDTIRDLVLGIEKLAGEMPGSEKAAAVKGFIGSALSIENQIESVWPVVSPIFNLTVSAIKRDAPAA